MQRLEVIGAVRPLYGSLGVKGLMRPKIYVIYDRLQISPSSDKLVARKPGFHSKQ